MTNYSDLTDDELVGLSGLERGRLRHAALNGAPEVRSDARKAAERLRSLSNGRRGTGYDQLSDRELVAMRASNSLGGLTAAADRGDASARRAMRRLAKLPSSGGDAA